MAMTAASAAAIGLLVRERIATKAKANADGEK